MSTRTRENIGNYIPSLLFVDMDVEIDTDVDVDVDMDVGHLNWVFVEYCVDRCFEGFTCE